MGKWIDALKQWNEGKGIWCIPRKGTKEYDEVKAIMNPPKSEPTTKKIKVKKSVSKADNRMSKEQEQMGMEDVNVNKVIEKIIKSKEDDMERILEVLRDEYYYFMHYKNERTRKDVENTFNGIYEYYFEKSNISKLELIDYLQNTMPYKAGEYPLYDILKNSGKVEKMFKEQAEEAEKYDKTYILEHLIKKAKEFLKKYNVESEWKKLKTKSNEKYMLALILSDFKEDRMTSATKKELIKLRDSVAEHLIKYYNRFGNK